MASIIRIKRSSGTTLPTLQYGELASISGIGSATGIAEKSDRIYIGDEGENVLSVGGRYYTSMMDHTPGSVDGISNTRNSDGGIVAIMDDQRKVDQWNVDNLRLDANTLSNVNTDEDLIIDTTGTGEIKILDDTFFTFGTDNDAKFEYDEDGTNQLTYTGADFRINVDTQSHNQDTGALIVEGGVGIEKNLNVGGDVTVAGIVSFTGSLEVDQIRIKDNVISTIEGGDGIMYLDPYPDGLSNEGTLVIKGDLQVDGTTTSVNSTVVSINDPILILGDVTSKRTVMDDAVAGVSTIHLDSVVGINTGDLVQGSSALPNSGLTTVTAYDSAAKIITIEGVVAAAGIATETQLTITHAFDTNTDRGIGFDYNTGVGTANNKTGYFGYIDGDTNTNSAAPARSWTYIPDATITSPGMVSGTRGFLDIKGLYYQSGDFSSSGVVYFDADGKQTSTTAPAAGISTSNQVLTVSAAGIPVWTTTLDGGTF